MTSRRDAHPVSNLVRFGGGSRHRRLPSIFGDMRQFAEALGMPSAEWQWWNYLMVGGGLFGMALGAQRMWAHWNKPRKKAHSVDAGPITHHWHVPQPTVTVKRASLFRRVRQSLGKGPKRGQGELGRVTAAGTPGSGRALPTCRSNYFKWLWYRITSYCREWVTG